MKIKILPPKHYAEIYQNQKVQFSYASKKDDTYEQLNPFFICRDFLGDVLYAEEENKEVAVYGFEWNPKKKKIDRDATRLLLTSASEGHLTNIVANYGAILEPIEKKNDFEPTKLTLLHQDKKSYLVVEGDAVWQSSIFLMSLFSFFMKVLSYKYKDPESWMEEIPHTSRDDGRLLTDGVTAKLKKILPNLRVFSKYVHGLGKDSYGYHDCTGFNYTLRYENKKGATTNKQMEVYHDVFCKA